ncbi:carbohydrate kinase FGGY [Beutenbergia cavernae DSM 12333]|uniref:Carbohydrate kinase FGGY n=1 Tax=Beutenbergia cavernae (strain ATCC BAA-8 / DSM 12333 / CCUG 43141 / JCM 11478 / NBRC 16432 / NCIMB 13614 / HKI 0122) TaxID=471853 RepID=C5C324_BEUC1|nr:rhamnulokinase family protein [Beutenbergia cavernae]ACQ81868.1 carbohydrate kinase FGGY [Beutenbergia cavernae DSM 12333]
MGGLPGDAVSVVAVDLGASSGRVMLARVGADELALEEVSRFDNRPVALPSGLHWDTLGLYRNVLDGVASALRSEPAVRSVGIDGWAVDYALLRAGRLIGAPFHYRDQRTADAVDAAHELVPFAELFAANGLQHLPFTTAYQLTADRLEGALAGADGLLLLPDLFAWWLTGVRAAERTNASTTGLLGARSREWDTDLAARLDVPAGLLPPPVDPGTVLGPLRPEVAAELGAGNGVTVVAVGSHDTASAVVAVPMRDPARAAYISSGTWSLVGVELEAPVLTDEAREAGFTNELGVDGRVRFLHNVMGLWLLSESVRTWRAADGDDDSASDLPRLLAEAELIDGDGVPAFDADDPRFLPGGDVPALIDAVCRETGQETPRSRAEYVRAICEALATAYARVIADAARVTGRAVEVVHVVGGGVRNALLCRLTAERTGLPVLAGPVEATALGNALVQARALGALEALRPGALEALRPGSHDASSGTTRVSLEDLRALVARTHPPRTYLPT